MMRPPTPVSSPFPRSASPLPPPLPLPQTLRLPPSPAASLIHKHLPSDPSALPWRLLLPIVFFRIADAATYIGIFPYIADMITSLHVTPSRIGLYTGLAEGSLMLVEALLATTWARLADKYGRRPTLIYGFAACLVASAMLGFSTQVWHVIFWRSLFGLNPIGVIGKIYASEISTPQNRTRLFAVFSPSFSFGIMMGTFLGGELARPYGRLPGWLGGRNEFWRDWPYALPALTSAGIGVFAVIFGLFFLIETRPPNSAHKHIDPEKRPVPASYSATLKVPQFAMFTFIFCCFQVTTMSWEGIYALWTYNTVPLGGLGLPVDTIGQIMSITAIFYIIVAPFSLPWIKDRLGTIRGLLLIFMTWPTISLLIPVATYFAGTNRVLMWMVLCFQLMCKCVGNFAWPLCEMLTVEVFDDYPDLLATGSAISLIAGAGGRALGPATSGWLYSLSTQYPSKSLGRQAAWLFELAVAVPPVLLVALLPRGGKRPARDDYESVPMVDAARKSSEDDDGRIPGGAVKVSALD